MCKSEIFAKIINIVSKETEVSVDQILSSDKNMETVDARYLLVFDIDGDPCRAFDEFFATCIGKGIPVIWSDVI